MSVKPGDWWDKSWNPVEGCTPISEACENCWALAMLKRFRGREPGEITYYPERLVQPSGWKKPLRIFVGSLTDTFHEETSILHGDWLRSVFFAMEAAPQHEYYFLTKRPEEMLRWRLLLHDLQEEGVRFALGITAENQKRFDGRAPHLAALSQWFKTFVSLEPLLGPIDLKLSTSWLDWVIVGGETGQKARPMHPDWVRSIRDQCSEAGVPFWFKSWGKWVPSINLGEPAICSGPSCCVGIEGRGTPDKPAVRPTAHMTAIHKCWRSAHELDRYVDGKKYSWLPSEAR